MSLVTKSFLLLAATTFAMPLSARAKETVFSCPEGAQTIPLSRAVDGQYVEMIYCMMTNIEREVSPVQPVPTKKSRLFWLNNDDNNETGTA